MSREGGRDGCEGGRETGRDPAPRGRRGPDDEARFLRSWLERPLLTGAVSPSGRLLARTMAAYVDPARPGPVVELGPGTGPVTDALIARGVAEERLVLVEYNAEFCALLRRRFPRATVVQGDAYRLRETVPLAEPASAVVSGLPLFNRPERERVALLEEAFALLPPGAPFVQFTYNVVSPIPLNGAHGGLAKNGGLAKTLPPLARTFPPLAKSFPPFAHAFPPPAKPLSLLGPLGSREGNGGPGPRAPFSVERSERIWWNLPPAMVWVYRRR